MLQLITIPLCAFLDRWGGGGFAFLGVKKGILTRGIKAARRFGIPAVVFSLNPTFEQALLSVVMGAILSFNLNEIGQNDLEEVFLHGFGLGAALWPIAGVWAMLIPVWWFAGVYLSNVGIRGKKLGWHWVELIRGGIIGGLVGV